MGVAPRCLIRYRLNSRYLSNVFGAQRRAACSSSQKFTYSAKVGSGGVAAISAACLSRFSSSMRSASSAACRLSYPLIFWSPIEYDHSGRPRTPLYSDTRPWLFSKFEIASRCAAPASVFVLKPDSKILSGFPSYHDR